MVVPITATENAEIASLASDYYDTCNAKSFNEKTAWIGIDLHSGVWKVNHYFTIKRISSSKNF